MKVRIREKSVKNAIHYCVQVKRCLFWKTVNISESLESAMESYDSLIKMDGINNPPPPKEEKEEKETVVMHGWMVRNQYTSGIAKNLTVYSDNPTYYRNRFGDICWSGNEIAYIQTSKKLFGDLGLEPSKIKITIEKL